MLVRRIFAILRDSLPGQSGARIARISALPTFVLGLTGWIPNHYLNLGSEQPWPWGALIGCFLICVGLVGVMLPERMLS